MEERFKRSKGKKEGGFDKFKKKENNKSKESPDPRKNASKAVKKNIETREEKVETSPRLNKYVANAGICSRRAADKLIADGEVTVNNQVVNQPGYHVQPTDKVMYQGREITPVEQKIYILLNKPRDIITTLSDEKGRKSIHDILKGKVSTHVFPVGRLDRDTTGLLLITNDGELTKRLSHPSYEVKKIYHATLDKPMKEEDLHKIRSGIQLEDGFIKVDGISFVKNAPPTELGITLHSGRNRIIRRIFEYVGYDVVKLDRVYYAGLTKKDLPRGRMRDLTREEVIRLKHFKV
jgi:23S rRNA pseudouridine2605 synthase